MTTNHTFTTPNTHSDAVVSPDVAALALEVRRAALRMEGNGSTRQEALCELAAERLIDAYLRVLTDAGAPRAIAQRELMHVVLRRLFGTKPDTMTVRIVTDLESVDSTKLALDIQVKKG
jgi:hypothetical protein